MKKNNKLSPQTSLSLNALLCKLRGGADPLVCGGPPGPTAEVPKTPRTSPLKPILTFAFALAIALALSVAFGAAAASPAKTRKKPAAKKPAPRTPAQTQAARTTASETVTNWLDAPLTLENPAALVPFLERLYRAEKNPTAAAPIHVLHYGDSHTASDDWAAELRTLFQSRFGNGGSGFSHAGRPYNGYRRYDVKSFGSLNWYTHGLVGRDGDGMYGLAGIAMTASRPNQFVQLYAQCQSAELLYLQQPGGGPFELTVDGGDAQRIETDGPTIPGFIKIPASPGEHRFEVRTLESKPVRLFGWTTDNGHGITWETLGINGAQAGMQLAWDADLLRAHITRRNPALIVLAYGTNEAGNSDLTLEDYRATFTKVLARMRQASPTASLLVIGPPDRWVRTRAGWAPMNNIDIVTEAQRQASKSIGAAFFDLRARMGGKGSMRSWLQAGLAQYDYVHLTSQGYKLFGAALYKELAGQFSAFQKVRDEVPGKTAIGRQN